MPVSWRGRDRRWGRDHFDGANLCLRLDPETMKREVFIPAMLPGLLALWLQYQAVLAGEEITSGEFAIVVGLVVVGLGVATLGRR